MLLQFFESEDRADKKLFVIGSHELSNVRLTRLFLKSPTLFLESPTFFLSKTLLFTSPLTLCSDTRLRFMPQLKWIRNTH